MAVQKQNLSNASRIKDNSFVALIQSFEKEKFEVQEHIRDYSHDARKQKQDIHEECPAFSFIDFMVSLSAIKYRIS